MLPNIESIEYVYIMHARSVMQQKKGKKKGKRRKEWKRDGKFNWVRQGENTLLSVRGIGVYMDWMSEVWE